MVAAATMLFMVAAASENNGRRGDHCFREAAGGAGAKPGHREKK